MDFASSSLFTADFAYENELDLSSLITPSTFIPFQEPTPSTPTIHCAGAENDGRQRIRETTTTDEITNEDVEPKNKKAKHREIERQRRQEVTSLFKNLRYILPSQYIKLSGKRIGILGLGSIGSLIAKRLEPFGCIISYNSTCQKQSIPYLYYPDVVSLAANNDVIVLCCALNDQTRHIVNREVMEALGKKGIIINVGRGGLIDEKEMVKCLVEGVIGGAGLDAFEKEPGVPVELFGLDNVVLSPHCAIATPGSFDNVVELALANLKAFFSNQPLISPVRLN